MNFSRIISYLFFVVLILFGAYHVKDFGIGWDEETQIKIGEQSYNFITKNDSSLFTFCDKDYGVGFELPVYALQQNFKSKAEQYYFRHYCIHFLFIIGLFFLFKSQLIFYQKQKHKYWLSLLPVLLIVLSPRIYADSFFNSKDIVLLSVSCINFFTLLKALEKPTKINWLIHAISTAILLDVRIIGLINVLLTVGIIVFKIVTNKQERKTWLINLAIYIPISAVLLYAVWPYLYYHPFDNFWNAFNNMKHFRWEGDVLFMGKEIKATQLPLYYSLVWISITTPVFYLFLFLVGLIFIIKEAISKSFFQKLNENHFLFLMISFALAVGPLTAVIIFKSVLYDGWRQLFYIYPYVIIIAVWALNKLISKYNRIVSFSLIIILVFQLGTIISFTFKNLPNSNVYFNEILPKTENYLVQNFERDYWGVGYKQGLEKVATMIHSPNDTIRVLCQNSPGIVNAELLNNNVKGNILVYDLDNIHDSLKPQMDYFIANYRWTPGLFPKCTEKIWSITIQNSDVISVFDLTKNKHCYEK